MKSLKVLSLAVILVCCATTTLHRLPAYEKRKAIRDLSGEALQQKAEDFKPQSYESFQARYLLAQSLRESNPAQSCEEFRGLSAEEGFWARELATARMWDVCAGPLSLTTEDREALDKKPWFKVEQIRAAHRKALRENDKDTEMRVGFEVAQLGGRKKDRVALIQRSIALAEQENHPVEKLVYLESLYRLAPRFRPAPPANLLFDVADDFRNAREFNKAIGVYRQIGKDTKRPLLDRIRGYEGIAKSYKLQLKKDEYIAELKALVKVVGGFARKSKDKSLWDKWDELYIQLARAEWTEGRPEESIAVLMAHEKAMTGRRSLEQNFWIRARIEEEKRDLESSLSWIEKVLKEPKLSKAFEEQALWQKAWLEFKIGKLEAARDDFAKLKSVTASPFAMAKYSFWLSRTVRRLGDASAADSELEQLTTFDTYGYYGMLARRDLKRPFILKELTDGTPHTKAPEEDATFDTVLFYWLMDVNETEVARRFLENYLNSHPGLSPQKMLYMAQAGLYNRVYSELSVKEQAERNKFIYENPEYFFPQQYLEHYEKAAAAMGVDRALLLAITRQESGFDPFARSHADAFGLMQVLPEVAASVAKRIDVAYQHPEDLYQPEVNIPIGANFIQSLLRKFDGSFIPGVGSYNASENAIKGWISTRYDGDPVAFVEEIPYEETKTYVKLVMRNFVFYSMLSSASGQIDFPENCLEVVGENVAANSTKGIGGAQSRSPSDESNSRAPSINRFSGL